MRLLQQGNQKEIQDRINTLSETQKINEQIAADAKKNFETFREEAAKNLNPVQFAEFTAQIATGVGEAGQQYKALEEAASKANAKLGDTSTELALLEQGSGKTAQSLDQIVTAAQKLQLISSDISNKASADLEAYKLANDPSATTKGLDDRIRSLQLESEVTKNSALAAQSLADSYGRATAEGQAAQVEADNLTKHQNALQTSIEALSEGFVRAAVTANELAAEADDIRKQQIQSIKTYDADILKNSEEKDKALADSQAKLNEALIEGANQSAIAAENLVIKLDQKLADLATSFGQGEIDAKQKAEYQELDDLAAYSRQAAQNARSHANDLEKISRDFAQRENDATLGRQFDQLYALQQQKTSAINESNIAYNQQQEAQLENFNAQEANNLEHYKREDAQRQLNYTRQLTADNLQYTREQ
nr:hypothetical protein [Anaerolineae bacterium]